MTKINHRIVALAIASMFVAAPSFAKDKDDDGQGKGNKQSQKHEAKAEKQAAKQERKEIKAGAYFNEQHRARVREYYAKEYGDGRKCPPGLAKKHNGCMPPGQAQWDVGQHAAHGHSGVHRAPARAGLSAGRPRTATATHVIGNDIVLVQIQSNLIVDIIVDLLS